MIVVIVIIVLFASLVILHEWGHFITAKTSGVDVEEFGIGFPPKLWGAKVRGTLYTINLIMLGGFVRLKGEDADDTGPGTFGAASFAVKAKILLAGVGMNLITAFVILYVLCIVGIPGLGAQFEPSFLKSTYAQPKQLILAQVEAGSPAASAGLKRGEYVISANGTTLVTDEALRDFTKAHAGQVVTFGVMSGSTERTVPIKLRSPNSNDGYLGVVSQQVYKLRYDPLSAVVAAAYIVGSLFVATIVAVVQLIINIPQLIIGLFSNSVPQAAEAASGPVGIVFILNSISSLGYSYIFLFMANIAVALAAFNVLPLPALDGGRLALIAWQRFTRKRISADLESRIHMAGFAALIGLVLIISVYDLRKYF
jgi:regulator of sigma E protease